MFSSLRSLLPKPPSRQLQQFVQRQSTARPSNLDGSPILPSSTTALPLRQARLIMVSEKNNNKFYDLQEQPDGTFVVNYGRVGSRGATTTYPIGLWDTKIREKLAKGYVDQTQLYARAEASEPIFAADEEPAVVDLMLSLRRYAHSSVHRNYLVAAHQVSPVQVETAQEVLDALVGKLSVGCDAGLFNEHLLDYYRVIPRKMKQVNEHLLPPLTDAKAVDAMRRQLAAEQEKLDVMRGQVALQADQRTSSEQHITLLQAMGLHIESENEPAALSLIREMMGEDAHYFRRAFRVANRRTQAAYADWLEQASDRAGNLFWHGSRNENWLSILQSGLVLRPAAVITGKMFGYGLYFADRCRKSLNYTSLRGASWANGRQEQAFLALFEVHLGKSLTLTHHQPWCYELTETKLAERGADYHSVFAKGGADLVNNEYIVYREAQATIRYLVEVGV